MGVEGFVTAIVDMFPGYLRRGYRKELFIGIMSVIWFLVGLLMVTEVQKHNRFITVYFM